MALSDCPKCWNTPCTCGYMGYDVAFHKGRSQYDNDLQVESLKKEIRSLKIKINELKKNQLMQQLQKQKEKNR